MPEECAGPIARPRSEVVLSDVPEQGLAGQPRGPRVLESSSSASRFPWRRSNRATSTEGSNCSMSSPHGWLRAGVTSLVAHELRGHEETCFRLGYYTSSEAGFRS